MTANRPDRRPRRQSRDLDLSGPTPSREHDRRSGQRPAIGLDCHLVARRDNAAHATAFDHLCPVPPGGSSQGADELAGSDEPMRRHHKAPDDVLAQVRLFGARRLRVEQPERDTLHFEPRGSVPEPPHSLFGDRNLQRTAAPVENRESAVGLRARDEIVEEIQAADRQIEKGRGRAHFNVRRENAGRRVRRPHARRSLFYDLHRRAAACKLIGHGAAHYSSADDDNIRGTGHGLDCRQVPVNGTVSSGWDVSITP